MVRSSSSVPVPSTAVSLESWLPRFVEHHGDAAYRTAYRLLRDRDDAHDAVQDALFRIVERARSFATVDDARAWFFRVLVNGCMSRHRRRAVRLRALALIGRPPPITASDPSVSLDVGERVLPHVDRLPTKQRTAMILRFGDDRSVAEIAAAMGVEPETVKTHLKRGLAELRRHLRPDAEDLR